MVSIMQTRLEQMERLLRKLQKILCPIASAEMVSCLLGSQPGSFLPPSPPTIVKTEPAKSMQEL